jgi:hypothetical protein
LIQHPFHTTQHQPGTPECMYDYKPHKSVQITIMSCHQHIYKTQQLLANPHAQHNHQNPHPCKTNYSALLRRLASIIPPPPPTPRRRRPLRLNRLPPQIRTPRKPPQPRSSVSGLKSRRIDPKVLLDIRRRLRGREPLFGSFFHPIIPPRNCIRVSSGCGRLLGV